VKYSSVYTLPSVSAVGENEMRFGPFLVLAILLVFVWFAAFLLFHLAALLLDMILLLALASLITPFLLGLRRPAKDRVRSL
jgi:hypothetical protein